MQEKIRYVTTREKADGTLRHYWQRRGFALTRLPDNAVLRYAKVRALNEAADRKAVHESARGSILWVSRKYQDSDDYKSLSLGTTKYYKRYLRDIEALGTELPFSAFDRPMVIDFLETYPAKHQRRQCAAVLKNLFNIARYYGIVEKSEMDDLRLPAGDPRTQIWSEEKRAAWLAAAANDPDGVWATTAFMLLQYTAQRATDCLRMARTRYDGDLITLRQQKTKALLAVPAHPALKAYLDALPLDILFVSDAGKSVSYSRFNRAWRRISIVAAAALGISVAEFDVQARDLRRTAMVNMAIAGATTAQIASVSGHSIEETQRILDTYIPKNVALARKAIEKLYENKESNALDKTGA